MYLTVGQNTFNLILTLFLIIYSLMIFKKGNSFQQINLS